MSATDDRAEARGPVVGGPVVRVGVVTVAYRSDDVLPGFLKSLPSASASPLATVVVDNLPAEGSAAGHATTAGARYLPLPGNPGYGYAINAATAELPAEVEWILVSNPDVALGPGAIDLLVAAGDEDRRIAAVGPRVRNPDGSVYPSARAVPSLRTGVGHALFTNLWSSNPWTRAYHADLDAADVRRDAGWLSGSCVLVRRSAFDEIGGFDDGYFMYFEDVDLGYRLGKHGYRNVYEPAAEVTHGGGHSTSTESERMIHAHHESARRFIHRKYAGPALAPVRLVLSLGLRMRSAWYRRRAAL